MTATKEADAKMDNNGKEITKFNIKKRSDKKNERL
jgi:hypothetical protein